MRKEFTCFMMVGLINDEHSFINSLRVVSKGLRKCFQINVHILPVNS